MEPMRMRLLLEKLKFASKEMKSGIYTPICELNAEYAVSAEPVPFSERETLEYKKIAIGDIWSKTLFECAWFHITGEVPSGYEPSELYLGIDIDGEGCIFSEEGEPVRGLTNVSSEFDRSLGMPGKRYVPFTDGTFRTDKIDLWLEAGHNDLFGEIRSGKVLQMGIYLCNNALRDLFYDFEFLKSLADSMDERNPDRMGIYYALERVAVNVTASASERIIAKMRSELAVYLNKRGPAEPSLTYYAVGHSHLDLAWLWPIRESKRKAGRTFSTALANIKDYDGYIYGASQPQQYEWLKECYPSLYERVKMAVADGRIEPQGGMWVEPDTNVTGGESLIRQIYYGTKFFRDEFGKDVDILWIPDVFGFSGALPQIMKGCGCPNLLTIKISWNMVNKFPYHSFKWQGIDGSEVLVHMPPEGTYNSSGAPTAIMKATGDYAERGIADCAMVLYGIGDGGGGPNREHLEFIKREADVCGLPRVRNATSAQFFKHLRTQIDKLPTYKGEMYLERHQGTYTSQAENKAFNRKIETALSEYELALAMCAKPYDSTLLDPIWKEVLLYQFHDILPGSSIKRVYDETKPRYEQMISILVLSREKLIPAGNTAVLNPTSYDRCEYVKLGDEWYFASAAPYSVSAVLRAEGDFSVNASEGVIENSLVCARFDKDGTLVSLYDKVCRRESMKSGNILNVYEDAFDAWDSYIGYVSSEHSRFKLDSAVPYVDGAEAGIRFEYSFGKSKISQTVYLKEGSPVLKFDTSVDWQETKKMLRVDFMPDIYTDEAVCDIQFGSIGRPMSNADSHEWAKYEICAHKWIDMSECGYGVALLNDSKYGHRAKDGTLSLNLLRSQMYPCVDQDKGNHHFVYAVMPHDGDVYSSDVAKEGYALCRPLILTSANERESLVRCDNVHAVIETVKPAYDGEGIIVRIYNDTPGRVCANLISDFSDIAETDMLERNPRTADFNITFKPFEIKTFKLTN